jgi:peptide/nickel transport system permease protein
MTEAKPTTKGRFRSTRQTLRIIAKSKRSVVGIGIMVFFLLMATVGVEITPLDLNYFNLKEAYEPPSLKHILGTDHFGRDVWAMIIHGSRDVLLIGGLAGVLITAVGVLIGISSGLTGGRVDMGVMSIVDIILTIPSFPLLIVLAAVIRQATDPLLMAGILSVTAWAQTARAMRSQVLSIKEREFIEASRCLGLPKRYIVIHELIPNLMPYIIVSFIFATIGAIYAQVGLFTLGLAPYRAVNWGMMLNMAMAHAGFGGAVYAIRHGTILAPVLFIVLVQVGLISLTAAAEEIFNPRLRED